MEKVRTFDIPFVEEVHPGVAVTNLAQQHAKTVIAQGVFKGVSVALWLSLKDFHIPAVISYQRLMQAYLQSQLYHDKKPFDFVVQINKISLELE